VRSLKRVHDQVAETLEMKEPTSSETIAERFNQILEDFQDEYPDNERLHQIDLIDHRDVISLSRFSEQENHRPHLMSNPTVVITQWIPA
jgi:hypothetical protein